jgi:hypothetical protein
MKSGDNSNFHNEQFRKALLAIMDRRFEQRTFSLRPALVTKEPVNGQRMWKEYHGERYDNSKFDLVEGMWGHEHCSVCWFSITDGYTYWENHKRIKLLCDACHQALMQI